MTEPPLDPLDHPLPTPTPADVARHRSWWVTALVDGGYRQTHGALRVDDEAGPRFCCLGVGEDVRRGRDAWRVAARPGVDHVGSHELLDVAVHDDDDDDVDFHQGVTLTRATQAWLGLCASDPTVVYLDDGAWTIDSLVNLNDCGRFDLARIADVLADQPADWTGDPVKADREALRRNARDALAGADEVTS